MNKFFKIFSIIFIVCLVSILGVYHNNINADDNVTVTFYPESCTSVDGSVARLAVSENWSSLITGLGNWVDYTNGAGVYPIQINSDINGFWSNLHRAIYLFDTSNLPSDAIIVSATFSLYGDDKGDMLGISPDINVYSANPSSNTSLINSDYSLIGSIPLCDTPISYNNWSVSGYNVFSLNSNGISLIKKDDITKLGVRNANYDVSGIAPNWSDSKSSYLSCYFSEKGVNYQPKLVITYKINNELPPTTTPTTTPTPTPTSLSPYTFDTLIPYGYNICGSSIVSDDIYAYVSVIKNDISAPAVVYKILKSNQHLVGLWKGDIGQNDPHYIMLFNGVLYISLRTNPAQVIALNPDTMTVINKWDGAVGQNCGKGLANDGVFIYLACYVPSKTIVVQINPVNMETTKVYNGLPYPSSGYAQSIVFDGNYINVSDDLIPFKIEQVDFNNDTPILHDTYTCPNSNQPIGGDILYNNGLLFCPTYFNPAHLYVINTSNMEEVSSLLLNGFKDIVGITYDGIYLYLTTDTSDWTNSYLLQINLSSDLYIRQYCGLPYPCAYSICYIGDGLFYITSGLNGVGHAGVSPAFYQWYMR